MSAVMRQVRSEEQPGEQRPDDGVADTDPCQETPNPQPKRPAYPTKITAEKYVVT